MLVSVGPMNALAIAAAGTTSMVRLVGQFDFFSPSAGKLLGGGTLQSLTDGIGGWALILSLVGLLVGAAAWALGAHAQNYQQAFVGRRAVLISGLAALLIGAAPFLLQFFYTTGTTIH
jgi:hypothetical protein